MAEGEARGGIDPAAGVVRPPVVKRTRHRVDDGAELLCRGVTPGREEDRRSRTPGRFSSNRGTRGLSGIRER